jgi:hypothetical protein
MVVRKRLSRIWLATEIEHYPSHFAPLQIAGAAPETSISEEDASWSTFSVLALRVDGTINPATTVSVVTTYSRGTAGFLNGAMSLFLVEGRVSYWFNDRVGAFVSSDYFGNKYADISFAGPGGQRYFGGIQFVLEPRTQ